jgi:Ca2+-binding RTX toxin-like protein
MTTTVSYMTKTELGIEPFVQNLDPAVKSALFNSLYDSHVYNPGNDQGKTAVVQYGDYQPITANIQILEVDGTANVQTDSALKAIIMDDGGVPDQLTLTGSGSVFVAMDNGADTVTLNDSGNDTVYGGKGNDTIYGGSGHDTLISGSGTDVLYSRSTIGGSSILQGGAGPDTLYGGGGADSLYGGAGQNVLIAGAGKHQLLQAGSGNTAIYDTMTSSTGTDTLIGGAGNDTIKGVQGDYFQDTGPAGSQNQFWLYAGPSGASSTLQGGKGDDTFHIETNIGNDTIIGGAGTNVVDFDTRTYSDYQAATLTNAPGGGYTLTFKDGQQFQLSGISELQFSDNHTVTLK